MPLKLVPWTTDKESYVFVDCQESWVCTNYVQIQIYKVCTADIYIEREGEGLIFRSEVQGPSSERNKINHVSLWQRAFARNVRPRSQYLQYTTNLLYFNVYAVHYMHVDTGYGVHYMHVDTGYAVHNVYFAMSM